MSRLPITIATWDYDRVQPLVDGRVRVEGVPEWITGMGIVAGQA